MVMARKAKKATKVQEKLTNTLDRFLGEADPMLPVVMIMGAAASACGIVPPFTRLLQMVGLSAGVDYDDMSHEQDDWLQQYANEPIPNPLWVMLDGLRDMFEGPSGENAAALKKKEDLLRLGMVFSGGLEAMMMYNVMKNPELIKAVIKAPAEMVAAVGEIIPG